MGLAQSAPNGVSWALYLMCVHVRVSKEFFRPAPGKTLRWLGFSGCARRESQALCGLPSAFLLSP